MSSLLRASLAAALAAAFAVAGGCDSSHPHASAVVEALAPCLRALTTPDSPFDRFLEGEGTALGVSIVAFVESLSGEVRPPLL